MAQQYRTPTQFRQEQPGDWTNLSGASPDDAGAYATLAEGEFGYLEGYALAPALPEDFEAAGIGVEVVHRRRDTASTFPAFRIGERAHIPLDTIVAVPATSGCDLDLSSPVDRYGRHYELFQQGLGYDIFDDGEMQVLGGDCISRMHGAEAWVEWNGDVGSSYLVLDMTNMDAAGLAHFSRSTRGAGAYRLVVRYLPGESEEEVLRTVRFDLILGKTRLAANISEVAGSFEGLYGDWTSDHTSEWQTTLFGGVGHYWGKPKSYWTKARVEALVPIVRRALASGSADPPLPIEEGTIVGGEELDVESLRVLVYHNSRGASMAERQSVKQRIHFGIEPAYGSGGVANKRLMSATINLSPQGEFREHRPQGNKLVSHEMLLREHSAGSIAGIPSYDEMGYFLESAIAESVSTGGVANEKNRHEWWFDNYGEQTPRSMRIEYGSNPSRAHRIEGVIVNEFGVEFGRGESSSAELTGNAFGREVEDGITMSPGINEVQTLTVTGTGGTYKLRYRGATTTALAFSANAAAIEAALNALSTIGADGVTVAGAGPFTITFDGANFAGLPLPMVEVDPALLTGGTATIASTTQGGAEELPVVPILPGQVAVYMADTYAGLDAGKLTRAHLAGFALTDRWGPYWTLGGLGGDDFVNVIETPVSARFNLSLQADSNGMALLGTARTGATRFIRMLATGGVIGATADPHKFILEAAVKVASLGNFEDDNGIYATSYELVSVQDPTSGISFRSILENGLVDYD